MQERKIQGYKHELVFFKAICMLLTYIVLDLSQPNDY